MPTSKTDYFRMYAGLKALGALQTPILEQLGYDNVETETLSRYGLGLSIEVGEFLNETPWKAWKTRTGAPMNRERVLEEFADMMLFIGAWINFLNLLGFSMREMTGAITDMFDSNYIRFGLESDTEDKSSETVGFQNPGVTAEEAVRNLRTLFADLQAETEGETE